MAQPQTVIVQQRPPTTLIVQHPQEYKTAFLRTATLVSQVTFTIFASFYLLLLMYGACRSNEYAAKQVLDAQTEIIKELQAGKNPDEVSTFQVSWLFYLAFGYWGSDDAPKTPKGEEGGLLVLSVMHVVFLFATSIAINVARCTPMFVTSTRKTVSTMVFLGLVTAAMLTVFIITVVRIAKISTTFNGLNELSRMVKLPEYTTAPMWMAEIWAFLIPLVCMPLLIVGWFKLPAGDENKGYATTTYGADAQAGDDI